MLDIETIRHNYRQAIVRSENNTSSPAVAEDQAACEQLFVAAGVGAAALREALAHPPIDPGPLYIVIAGQLREFLGDPGSEPPHIPHTFG